MSALIVNPKVLLSCGWNLLRSASPQDHFKVPPPKHTFALPRMARRMSIPSSPRNSPSSMPLSSVMSPSSPMPLPSPASGMRMISHSNHSARAASPRRSVPHPPWSPKPSRHPKSPPPSASAFTATTALPSLSRARTRSAHAHAPLGRRRRRGGRRGGRSGGPKVREEVFEARSARQMFATCHRLSSCYASEEIRNKCIRLFRPVATTPTPPTPKKRPPTPITESSTTSFPRIHTGAR